MDCQYIPIIPYREFSSPIHNEAARKNLPIVVEFDLTLHCNLSCAHCYCAKDINNKELTFDEVCRILDEVTQAGCLWLLLTGGEPLIRPDFLDIYTYAKKKGLIITIFTNGTLITPQIADYLRQWPPFSIEISLYGATQETYERVTGVAGSYKKCITGIDILIQRKLPLTLKTLVTTLNKHELWMMKRYAQERDLNFKFDTSINPRLDGNKEPCRFRIPAHEAVQLDLADEKRRESWEKICQNLGKATGRKGVLYPCSFSMWSLRITAYGQLHACLMIQEPSFDLRSNSFSNCWPELIEKMQAFKSSGKSRCQSCELLGLCNPCPAWAKLENGDYNSLVEYNCQVAHLRAEAFKERGFINNGGENYAEESEKTLQASRII